MISRRRLLSAGAAASLAAAGAAADAPPVNPIGQGERSLNGAWRFRLDTAPPEEWREVTVPHTWQVEPANTDYYGVAWYRRRFDVPKEWAAGTVRVEFEAVFHSATVWINGKPAGDHIGKGYTAFTLDIGPLLKFGEANEIRVRVDNAFNENMLPRGRSSDWAHDGGIYRPVRLIATPKVFLERVAVDAAPARIAVTAVLRNTSAAAWSGRVGWRVEDEAAAAPVAVTLSPGETRAIELTPLTLREPKLWHFDHPHLYRAVIGIEGGHSLATTFGVRTIEIRGTAFFLNGERVRLMGVERMAGSNPEYGMAEPAEWIAHDHADMRELNCVYTRVHWPQDSRVLDWCDRHGMLIQTEVPTWGGATFRGMGAEPSPAIMENGLEQLREMVARDRNHPCIFSWGVCNEIGGQNPPAYAFAKRMYEEAKRLDPKRPVTYASHSLFTTPEKDVAGLMDYVMFNEYVGSWRPGTVEDLARYVDDIHRAFPDKPLVISEYGYCACTPDRPEGDGHRVEVLLGHDKVFRERDYIAGLIFFCYNDYRTHVGDRGVGALKQRVHGVVDVYGAKKPSWDELRRQASPIEGLSVSGKIGELRIALRRRSTVPAYALRGYRVRALVYGYGDIPVERVETPLDDAVTVKFAETRPVLVKVDVVRPDGACALTEVWKP